MSVTQQQPLHLRLKTKRAAKMLSQEEAANELGVSRRIYQAWEHGDVTTPQPRIRRRIEEWLAA